MRRKSVGVTSALLACCVSIVCALPQLLYFADGYDNALIQALDEAPYVARVQEVMNGHWRPVDQYLWESKSNQFLLPYGAELAIGLPARLLGVSIDTTMIVIRFLAPAVLALALCHFLFTLTGSAPWSALGAALVLLEPGSFYSQPFQYLTTWLGHPARDQMSLLYTRFHNPVVLALPFVLAATSIYKAVESEGARNVRFAGLMIGVNFYTQLFYWTYLYAGLALLAMCYWRDDRRTPILTIAALGLMWGSIAIIEQAIKTSTLADPELILRAGLLLPTRRPIFLFPKGLVAVVTVLTVLYRVRDLRRTFMLCFLVGGYLLLNQNVITGRELQNYHFNYANGIMTVGALVVTAQYVFQRLTASLPSLQSALASRLALAAALAWLMTNGVALQARTYSRRMSAPSVSEGQYPSNLKRPYEQTMLWIADNTEVDAVFLADEEVSFLIPIYTGGNVFLNPLENDHLGSFVTEQELFERWMIQLKLQGASDGEVFERTRHKADMAYVGWGFGRSERLMKRYPFADLKAFNRALLTDKLPRDYVEEYRRFPASEILERLRRYRIDYLVTARDVRFAETARRRLVGRTLTKVAELPDEQVTIFRLGGHSAVRP